MKYLLLLALLCSANVSFAQETPTTPGGGTFTPADNNTPGGGAFTTYDAETVGGGAFSPYNANTPGGGTLVPVSGGQTSGGGTFNGLKELNKPSLTIVGISNWFIQILNYISILLFTASLVVFMYGVFLLMFVKGTDVESRTKGRQFMMWGIISLFVMTSTWGLVNILKSSIFGSTGGLSGPQFK